MGHSFDFFVNVELRNRFEQKVISISRQATLNKNSSALLQNRVKGARKKLDPAVEDFFAREKSVLDSGASNGRVISFFGFSYNYDSETDDEKKYVTKQNKGFKKLTRTQREAAVLKLWRKAFIKAFTAQVFVNQFYSIQIKCAYFGRQMIGDRQNKEERAGKLSQLYLLHKKDGTEEKKCLIMPDSLFFRAWHPIMGFCVFYTVTVTTYQVAFVVQTPHETIGTVDIVNFIVDSLFIVDLIVTFFMPYQKYDHSYELNHKKIATRYLKTTFLIDLLACLPSQLIPQSGHDGGVLEDGAT